MWKETSLMLFQSLYSAYVMLLVLRFFLQLVHADFYNPVTQVVVKLTMPVIWPLQKILPSWRNVSFAALVGVVVLEMLDALAVFMIENTGTLPHFKGLGLWVSGDIINHVANLFFFVILIQALMSWFQPRSGRPLLEILYRLSLPVLRPFQRIIPPIAGIDFSAIPALLLLKCVVFYVGYPLCALGWSLM